MKHRGLILLGSIGFVGCTSSGDATRISPPASGEQTAVSPMNVDSVASSSSTAAVSASSGAASVLVPSLEEEKKPINDPRWHETLKMIAISYESDFYRADGTWWSPLDCRAPPPEPAAISAVAASERGHGRKLYTLHIADFDRYAALTNTPIPKERGTGRIGPRAKEFQAIVKASYDPTQDKSAASTKLYTSIESVTMDGKTFYAGTPKELFIMVQVPGDTKDTDEGWIYGTVSRDGKTVTSSGRVASCVNCHARAPHGRLFGIKK
jgi:hypothetical protein